MSIFIVSPHASAAQTALAYIAFRYTVDHNAIAV